MGESQGHHWNPFPGLVLPKIRDESLVAPWVREMHPFRVFIILQRRHSELVMQTKTTNNYCRMIRTATFSATVLFLLSCNVSALQMVEREGLYIYFPEQEAELVARFTESLPDMLAFLDDKGLPAQPPLHLILDDRLDAPRVRVQLIPHKKIRIPIRAPGVLEDGYAEADPWAYFMFKGLCLQGIYALRSGIPGLLHKGLGEVIAPNLVFPPWVDDGVCSLLYSLYRGKQPYEPVAADIFKVAPVPSLDVISHYPQVWPGYHAHRIYGRPFVAWIYQRYGWEKILEFLQVHGRGIIPFEIDLKAKKVFGKSGATLWSEFQALHPRRNDASPGLLIEGYWNEPRVYWNNAGVFPGKLRISNRGRYGYADAAGTLWISEYDGMSQIHAYRHKIETSLQLLSIWDPGPGRVAVGRRGHNSWILVFPDDGSGGLRRARMDEAGAVETIPAPPGVIQLSGPVRNERGQIAVAANLDGNWDIWVHDGQWRRLTDSPSIELDPWWEGETLVWASNSTGKFQIHRADNTPITVASYGAMLPRDGKYLELTPNGWRITSYETRLPDLTEPHYLPEKVSVDSAPGPSIEPQAYSPFKSLWPNYIKPDIFAGITDFQLGITTAGEDVSGDYQFESGLRYSFDDSFLALQALFQRKTIGTRYARYPFGYDNELGEGISEDRNDIALYWRPFEEQRIEHAEILRAKEGSDWPLHAVDLSLNWRYYDPDKVGSEADDEGWIGLAAGKVFGIVEMWGNFELFTENRQTLSGGVDLSLGDQTITSLRLFGGRIWGEPNVGRDAFRVGGDLIEGDFTRRPTRLFPIRGFESGVLDGTAAAAASLEVSVPVLNLQAGYKSLPLFLHRLRLGTFVDAGYADNDPSSEDLLVGGGFELVTSLQAGWEGVSNFRIGISWPLVQPDGLNAEGPRIVFQLGQPL